MLQRQKCILMQAVQGRSTDSVSRAGIRPSAWFVEHDVRRLRPPR